LFITNHGFSRGLRAQAIRWCRVCGENAAAVDIAYQQTRSICGVRHPHVDNVVLPKIDLRGRTGTFEQDQVVARRQRPIAFKHGGK